MKKLIKYLHIRSCLTISSRLTQTVQTGLDISKLMIKKNISSVVITDNNSNKIIGIVTERDLIRNVCVPNILASSITAARNLMSSPLLTITKKYYNQRSYKIDVREEN